jgi:hypothetical protein
MRWLLIVLVACRSSGGQAIDASLGDTGNDATTQAFIFLGSSSLQDFGSVVVNQTAHLPVIVTNGGGMQTGDVAATVTGTDATDFTLDIPDCGSLQSGESCTFTVTFTPPSVGAKVAQLAVVATPGGMVKVALKGTGM